ncbi:hypothetical protein ACFQ58_03805 [Agromyces sp. NPDC056523]|uniref:hypothetical protein n=1 Tax=Agromyces sp. NPDC056523 TaxID=3345850 RepID=UPI003670A41F
MTSTTPAASSTPTAPTEPIPPRPADANPPVFHPAPGTPAGGGVVPPTAATPRTPERTPWYRRAWVLAIGALLLALLCFASGFVAGNAAALFNDIAGVPAGGPTGPGWMDGDGDGSGPGRPDFGDRGFPGQSDTDGGTSDGTLWVG